jgi:hypothetical protein
MTVSYRQHLLHLEKMQNEVTERDRDGDLMSFVGRYSDCGDARWTPPYRDSQVVTVNIKMTSCTKYMRACRHSGAQPCLRRPWHFAAPLFCEDWIF